MIYLSQNVGTSNNPNPLGVDSDSGDRRFVYLVPSKKYKKKPGEFWDNMVKHMSKAQAIAALYDYLNTIDVSGYDFKLERKKVLTPRYYEWIGQNRGCLSTLWNHSNQTFLSLFCPDLLHFTTERGLLLHVQGYVLQVLLPSELCIQSSTEHH